MTIIWYFAPIAVIAAFLIARFNHYSGNSFWRDFFMALLMIVGIGAFIISLFFKKM
jgi:hypothetical protein